MEKLKHNGKNYEALPLQTCRKFIREVADGSRRVVMRTGMAADKIMTTNESYERFVGALEKGECPTNMNGLRDDFNALSLCSSAVGGGKVVVEVLNFGVVRLRPDTIGKLAEKYDDGQNCERYNHPEYGFAVTENCNPGDFSLADRKTAIYWFHLGEVLKYEEPKGEVVPIDPVS